MTAIRVAADNLQSSWPDERERREQSELIVTEVDRLTRLFQNILEMARIDAGAVTNDARWVAPSEIVDAARSRVEHALRGRTIEVSVESDRLVRLDPRLPAAALSHLLENAAQYSPRSSSIQREGHRLERWSDDHGARSWRRHCAAPICRTCSTGSTVAPTRKRAGRAPEWGSRSLAACWRSKGTDFCRELRRRRRPVHDCRAGGGEMNRPPRILLVDDEVAIQRAVAPLLRSRGYEVEVVGTGKEAVDAVVDRRPDLDRARPRPAGSRRHRSVPPYPKGVEGARS